MAIRTKRLKSGAVHSHKIPAQNENEHATTVHVMEGGNVHKEIPQYPLRITLITGEIRVNDTTLSSPGEITIAERRVPLDISTHRASAYTVQRVDRRENTAPG